jgi:hypothetical protein
MLTDNTNRDKIRRLNIDVNKAVKPLIRNQQTISSSVIAGLNCITSGFPALLPSEHLKMFGDEN